LHLNSRQAQVQCRSAHFVRDSKELYEITRGVWDANPEARDPNPEFALAVFQGVVQEVYAIQSWHPGGSTPYTTRPKENVDAPERCEFLGKIAPEAIREKYRLKSVDHIFKSGAQNPIKYVRC